MQVRPLRDTWERGILEGTLRVPEGVPFLWNVFDHPLCQGSEVRAARACTAQHSTAYLGATRAGGPHACETGGVPFCQRVQALRAPGWSQSLVTDSSMQPSRGTP